VAASLRLMDGARPEGAHEPAVARVVRLGGDDRSSQRVRIVDAALRCIGAQGLQKTTADDIARERVSRGHAVSDLPGGRTPSLPASSRPRCPVLLRAGGDHGEADDLEDVLVAGMVEAAARLRSHEPLARLLADEPGVVLARLSFAKLDGLLRVASDFAAPFFARWLGPDEASRAAEWAVRIVISYLLSPSQGFDLADAGQTRRLVATFVLPGVVALGALGDPAP